MSIRLEKIRLRVGKPSRSLILSLYSLLLLAASFSLAVSISSARAQGPTPTPTEMIPMIEMLSPPPLPHSPAQADYGAQVYYYVCMACHGDAGQGLTPEWIEQWGLERNACWQSKCHASNYPEEGFELPRAIPGVVGPQVLNRFTSALELYNYLRRAMPWHAPGSLKDEEYWQLTAYLVRLNGIDPGGQALDVTRADALAWGEVQPGAASAPALPPARDGGWGWLVAGLLAAGLLLAAILGGRARRR